METNRTCIGCKKTKDIYNFKSKRDRIVKTCQTCRDYKNTNRKYCVHGKQKHRCKDCNGSSICEHRRERNKCKDCNGASICEHGRIRSQCKDCNGSSICEHGRIRNKCKDCHGASICEHKRLQNICKDCNGSSICEHQRRRNRCKDCNGASICEHGRLRFSCKICDPAGHLAHISRSRIRSALKNNKEFSSKEYIGCSIETFKQHIESQFKPDMSWDNHGSLWHIDHKIPLKYNNPTIEEVIERLHYTNTQPLYATENIAKGNRYIS